MTGTTGAKVISRLHFRIAIAGSAALVLCGVMTGCSETIQPSQHLVVEREWLSPDLRIQPHQMIQIADGSLIVAGESSQVNAVALSKDGELLWQYQEPHDPNIPDPRQSSFAGVAPLADGNLLFCGEKKVANPANPQRPGFHTITTVLNAQGTLKASNTIEPDDPSLRAEGFLECSSFEDGALIVGRIFGPASMPPLFWLVKVDREGKKKWERVGNLSDEFKPPFTATNATASGAIFSSFSGGSDEILYFTHVSLSGQVTNTHDFRCGYYLLILDAVEPSDTRSVLCAPTPNDMVVFRLTGGPQPSTSQVDLKDALHSKFIAQLGKGFELKDGSFLVFGRIPTQTGDRALIELFDKAGHSLGFRGYDLKYPSFGVESVVSLGNNRFLALRPNLNGGGTILSWVRVQ
jgi:hypothetical protein